MIRELRPDEYAAAAALIRAAFLTVAREFGLTEENCPRHTAFVASEARLNAQAGWGWRLYGSFDGEGLVGFASISDAGGGAYEIHNLCVAPPARHRGLGAGLLRHCLGEARGLGAERAVLSMIWENARLLAWYEAAGFALTGTERYPHLPFTVGRMERGV